MIVDTTVPITSERCDQMIRAITEAYPFCRTEFLGSTAYQRPIRTLAIGTGPRKVIFSAAHHANEWITSLILLRYAEELAQAIQSEGTFGGISARELSDAVTIYMVPMVDPDGVDLVVGAIRPGELQYVLAQSLGQNYTQIPFPEGWKANLLGVDLNLNYPAGWLMAREIKFSQGYTQPGPRDFVGRAPLNQLETQALAGYTEYVDPALVVALHSQGREIYWQYGSIEVSGARELGEKMAQVSGYTLAEPAYASSFAGYKDWFIKTFRRPGYTVEVGSGENPLPLSQFPEIYQAMVPLLNTAALGT